MDLNIGSTYIYRERGDFTHLPVVNMFAETVPTEEGVSLLSRPGLTSLEDLSISGAITGLYQNSGVFGGDLFLVSIDGTVWGKSDDDPSVELGNFPTAVFNASISAFPDTIFFCDGTDVMYFNGTTLAQLTVPNSDDIQAITVGAGRLIALKKDSGLFYWSDVSSTTIDSLSFSTAENSPDLARDILFVGDSLIIFGTETVEFWQTTTSADSPFLPLKGRTFEVGLKDTGACTEITSGFAWVSPEGVIFVNDPNQRITFPGLEAILADAERVYLRSFFLDGSEFICVNIYEGSGSVHQMDWVYSISSGTWSRFLRDGYNHWTVSSIGGQGYFGGEDGHLYTWNTSTTPYVDFGGELQRLFRAGAIIKTGNVIINNVRLRTIPGRTDYSSGLYRDPIIEMRVSKDGGKNWSEWKQRLLGAEGEYRKEITWNSQGMFSQPYFLTEFRVTDPVDFRVSNVVINENRNGR